MPRKQTRGNVRNKKAGLLSESDMKRVTKMRDLCLDYLETELEILRMGDGNFKEVLQIARTLEALRASGSGEPPAPPSPRDNFSLEFDDS